MKTVLLSMRPPFLILTPACVLLGVGAAVYEGIDLDGGLLGLVLAGALLAHIAVNTLNEYHDFRSGLDLNTVRTPFSGGSGALPNNPDFAGAVLAVGVTSVLLTGAIGIVLIARHGWAIAPLGLLGLALIAAYTPWINRNAWACLVAPGIGFGFLMVAGTHFALTGSYSPLAFWAAAVPFFQVNNLLLLNQLPDVAADREAGRRHLAIRYGARAAASVYGAFAASAYAVIAAAVAGGVIPPLGLISLVTAPLAWFSWQGAARYGEKIGERTPRLAANVAVAILTPALLGIALMLA